MKVGFALRSSVFHPSLIVKIAPLLQAANVDSIWFPDAGMPFDALDLCAVALGSARRVRVGTGVIRAGEQDPARLSTRVRTLSESSEGRFILGLGAGQATGPQAIEGVVALAEELRAAYRGGQMAPIFFAALRGGMLRAALSNADGAILNFCPPSHVEKILPKGPLRRGSPSLATSSYSSRRATRSLGGCSSMRSRPTTDTHPITRCSRRRAWRTR